MGKANLIDEFEQDCQVRGLEPETIRRYLSSMRIYKSFLDDKKKSLSKPDKQILRDFVKYLRDERKVSQKTIDNYFAALSAFYKYLTYDEKINYNPIPEFKERYVQRYKDNRDSNEKRLLSVEDMSIFVSATTNIRDKAIILLLAKTGVRRGELLSMDVGDIDWREQSITLKPKAKRSNRIVFFDDETARVLRRYMAEREDMHPKTDALFIGRTGDRLNRQGIYKMILMWAEIAGINDPDRPESNISPHSMRHHFTTFLIRNGMPREYVKELRGDARKDSLDVYYHIDREDLRRKYLACVPQFGV